MINLLSDRRTASALKPSTASGRTRGTRCATRSRRHPTTRCKLRSMTSYRPSRRAALPCRVASHPCYDAMHCIARIAHAHDEHRHTRSKASCPCAINSSARYHKQHAVILPRDGGTMYPHVLFNHQKAPGFFFGACGRRAVPKAVVHKKKRYTGATSHTSMRAARRSSRTASSGRM